MSDRQRILREKTTSAIWASSTPEGFDDEQWQGSKPVLLEKYWSGEKASPHRQATARVLWNDQGLFVLFHCMQREELVVEKSPQTSCKVIGLWDRDVCETFLARGSATPSRYFEFEAAPTGEWLDIKIHLTEQGRECDWEFTSGMSVQAKVEADRVLILMFIPWSAEIPKPAAEDVWRVNFYRCIGRDEDRGYLAWQPTFSPEPNFHVPEAFGWLRFEK